MARCVSQGKPLRFLYHILECRDLLEGRFWACGVLPGACGQGCCVMPAAGTYGVPGCVSAALEAADGVAIEAASPAVSEWPFTRGRPAACPPRVMVGSDAWQGKPLGTRVMDVWRVPRGERSRGSGFGAESCSPESVWAPGDSALGRTGRS